MPIKGTILYVRSDAKITAEAVRVAVLTAKTPCEVLRVIGVSTTSQRMPAWKQLPTCTAYSSQ